MGSDRFENLPRKGIFSIFFTAGFPNLDDTATIIDELATAGVDMIEIGMPFSDPVADGPTIQAASMKALENGMSVEKLFAQLVEIRARVSIPLVLMGYLNPVEQFGFERFLKRAQSVGIDALILPDLPFEEYERRYRKLYEQSGIRPVFLVTSRTPEERIRRFDETGPAFLYIVSTEATTGGRAEISDMQREFFERLRAMQLKSRLIVGFGVADRKSFDDVTRSTDGAIVGSAFIRCIANAEGVDTESRNVLARRIKEFVSEYRSAL